MPLAFSSLNENAFKSYNLSIISYYFQRPAHYSIRRPNEKT